MNALFLDCDGVLYDDYLHDLYLYSDFGKNTNDRDVIELIDSKRVLEVCDWAIDTNTKIVISSLIYDKNRFNYIKEIMNQKGLEPYGRIKIKRRRIDDHSYNDAWKEYGISDFLAKHDEIDHFAIIDDEMVDLHTFEDYVSLVDNRFDLNDEDYYRFYKDLEFRKRLCSEIQGLQPKHLEEATKILKKENIFRGKIWE